MKVVIHSVRAVGQWTWNIESEFCSICRQPFDGCCPDCKLPGDDCPPVFGRCNHPFHIHCILKWLSSQQSTARNAHAEHQQQCPLCRQEWVFAGSQA